MMGFSLLSSEFLRMTRFHFFTSCEGRTAPPASGTDDQIVLLFKQANLLRSCWVGCLLNPLRQNLHLLSLYRCSGKGLPVNTFPCEQAHFLRVTYRLPAFWLFFSQVMEENVLFFWVYISTKRTEGRSVETGGGSWLGPLTQASLDKIVESTDRTQTFALYCQKRTCPQFRSLTPKCPRQVVRKLRDNSFNTVSGKMQVNILRRGKIAKICLYYVSLSSSFFIFQPLKPQKGKKGMLETFKASKIRRAIWVITDSDVKHNLQGRAHISICKGLHRGLHAHSRFLQLHQPVIRPEPVTTTSATKINTDDDILGDTII